MTSINDAGAAGRTMRPVMGSRRPRGQFALLEERLLLGFTGSGGADLPGARERRLAEPRALMSVR